MFALLPLVLTLNDGAGAADPVLAPTGTLRAAYIVSNVAQARLDSGTGAITGVVADITRALGRRAGVPVDHLDALEGAGRNRDGEGAPGARLAGHGNVAAEHLREPARDGESQTGAAKAARR